MVVITMQAFISNLSKSNDGKFLCVAGGILQIWAALGNTVTVPHFLVLRFGKRVTLQLRRLYL